MHLTRCDNHSHPDRSLSDRLPPAFRLMPPTGHCWMMRRDVAVRRRTRDPALREATVPRRGIIESADNLTRELGPYWSVQDSPLVRTRSRPTMMVIILMTMIMEGRKADWNEIVTCIRSSVADQGMLSGGLFKYIPRLLIRAWIQNIYSWPFALLTIWWVSRPCYQEQLSIIKPF